MHKVANEVLKVKEGENIHDLVEGIRNGVSKIPTSTGQDEKDVGVGDSMLLTSPKHPFPNLIPGKYLVPLET